MEDVKLVCWLGTVEIKNRIRKVVEGVLDAMEAAEGCKEDQKACVKRLGRHKKF